MGDDERQQLRAHDLFIREIARKLTELLEERDKERSEAGMDKLRELVREFYGQTTSYTNLVIVAGYAAVFGVWQFVDKYISVKTRIASALFLLISILLFVGWEVWKMITEGWRMRYLAQAVQSVPPARRLEAIQAILNDGSLRNARIWTFVVMPTAATGFMAGFLLACAFAAKLFGYWFLP